MTAEMGTGCRLRPKVSIVVPIYNNEGTVREALSSLTCQTYDNIEIVAVNDGSTDASPRIIREEAERDQRIFFYSKENGGAASARNYGLERVTGDYVMFLDADDILLPRAVETLLSAASEGKYDIVSAGLEVFGAEKAFFLPSVEGEVLLPSASLGSPKRDSKGCEKGTSDAPDGSFENARGKELIHLIFSGADRAVLNFAVKLYRRDVIAREHVTFPLIVTGEDTVFAARCLLSAEKILFLKDAFYRYRKRDSSATSRSMGAMERLSLSDAFFLEMEALAAEDGRAQSALFDRRLLALYDFAMGISSDSNFSRRRKLAELEILSQRSEYLADRKKVPVKARICAALLRHKRCSLCLGFCRTVRLVKRVAGR